MASNRHKKGSTLVEVLVSLAILASTGVFTVGFLYRNTMTNRVWTDDYGADLSKAALLTAKATSDTTLLHTDARGIPWETVIKVSQDDYETCLKATSIRYGADTTRTLHYCTYGVAK